MRKKKKKFLTRILDSVIRIPMAPYIIIGVLWIHDKVVNIYNEFLLWLLFSVRHGRGS
jgi:hypothetical protein